MNPFLEMGKNLENLIKFAQPSSYNYQMLYTNISELGSRFETL